MGEQRERLWDIEDVASYLGIPLSSVYKMTAPRSTSPIPHLKLGGRVRFRKADIDAWLDLWAVAPTETLAKARRAAASRRG